MSEEKPLTRQIGNYNELEVWVSNDDYWVTHGNIAVHSFCLGNGKNRIFIRKEAYNLLQTSPRFGELMRTLYDHEYAEFLNWAGQGESPHENGRNHREQELDKFLIDNGYFSES